jgi:hypothetical protein
MVRREARVKIAFLILSHRAPAQLLRLLGTIRSQLPDSPLVVHHDVFSTDLDRSALADLGDAHLLTSEEPVRWGDYSLVDCTWRALGWMADHLEFDWVILLSAQDYPIKPLAGLVESLTATSADAMLRATRITDLPTAAERRNARQRYLYQYYRPHRQRPSAQKRQRSVLTKVRETMKLPVDVFNNLQPNLTIYKFPDGMPWQLGRRARQTPFTAEQPCWFGSAWFGLSRRAVEYLLRYISGHPEYVDHFRHTVCPDESATATALCNAPELKVESRNLHYVRWSDPRSGHPDVLATENLPELLASPAFFARKFDITRDAAILDQLDALISPPTTK